jgi:hypothetical protein
MASVHAVDVVARIHGEGLKGAGTTTTAWATTLDPLDLIADALDHGIDDVAGPGHEVVAATTGHDVDLSSLEWYKITRLR